MSPPTAAWLPLLGPAGAAASWKTGHGLGAAFVLCSALCFACLQIPCFPKSSDKSWALGTFCYVSVLGGNHKLHGQKNRTYLLLLEWKQSFELPYRSVVICYIF